MLMKCFSVEDSMKPLECRTLLVSCNVSKFQDPAHNRAGAELDDQNIKIAFQTNYDCEIMELKDGKQANEKQIDPDQLI